MGPPSGPSITTNTSPVAVILKKIPEKIVLRA